MYFVEELLWISLRRDIFCRPIADSDDMSTYLEKRIRILFFHVFPIYVRLRFKIKVHNIFTTYLVKKSSIYIIILYKDTISLNDIYNNIKKITQ